MGQGGVSARNLVWIIASACAEHGKPFDAALLLGQLAPPYGRAAFIAAARAPGVQARITPIPSDSPAPTVPAHPVQAEV